MFVLTIDCYDLQQVPVIHACKSWHIRDAQFSTMFSGSHENRTVKWASM